MYRTDMKEFIDNKEYLENGKENLLLIYGGTSIPQIGVIINGELYIRHGISARRANYPKKFLVIDNR